MMNCIKSLITLLLIVATTLIAHAQVGIGTETPDPSAALDISSTDKGLLIPRVDTSLVSSPTTGLMVFQPSNNGFYFYNGSKWQILGSVATATISDMDGDTKIQVEESSDEDIIRFDIEGDERLTLISEGLGNTRIEWPSVRNNMAMGFEALKNNASTANANIAMGFKTLTNNISGGYNTAIGYNTLRSNQSGGRNIGIGYNALYSNTSGHRNIGLGLDVLLANTTGSENIGLGTYALDFNNTGWNNIALGEKSLRMNNSGSDNIAIGRMAGENVAGSKNIMLGTEAGSQETGSNKLYIENTNADSNNALIYGEFDNDLIKINGDQIVKNNLTVEGQLIVKSISDADQDTKVTVEGSTDEDWIRMSIKGDDKFVFTSDETEMGRSRINLPLNQDNVAIGYSTLTQNTAGSQNLAFGSYALAQNTDGHNNIGIGEAALEKNTSGSNNNAMGKFALKENTTGGSNVAIGQRTLEQNNTGSENVALGGYSLQNNTIGNNNVAIGWYAMNKSSIGNSNTATGEAALEKNTSGSDNVANGSFALQQNTTGTGNTGIGKNALKTNTSGVDNVAIGNDALGTNSIGSGNVAIGFNAGKYETGSNRLYIENTNADKNNALIYGEFDNNYLQFNGRIGMNKTHSNIGVTIQNPSSSYNKIMEIINSNDNAKFTAYENGNIYIKDNLSIGTTTVANGYKLTVSGSTYIKDTLSIGTTAVADGYKLSVDGKIMAEEVRVLLSTDWPDYVFNEQYELIPLDQLEKEIKSLGHLPGMPSAQQIESTGQDLGEISRLQMEKIEELTLYIIELEKRLSLIEKKSTK